MTEAQFNILLKAGVRSSKIAGADFVDLTNFSFEFVKRTIPDSLESNDIATIIKEGCKELNHKPKPYSKDEEMQFLLWVLDELKSIKIMESENLTSAPNLKSIQAGANNFQKYGDLNTIIAVSRNFNINFDDVWKKKYSEVFELQLFSKEENEYNQRLAELSKKK